MSLERVFGRRGKRADGFNADVVSRRAERQDRRERPGRGRGLPFPTQVAAVVVGIFVIVTGVDRLGIVALVDRTAAAAATTVPSGRSLYTGSLPICSGDDRAEREVTCIVDGDTGWLHGVKWRMIAIDAPEIGSPGCAEERRLGDKSRDRLRDLMSGGYSFDRDGHDRYGRALVTIKLADGRDAGDVLMSENLAQPWPGLAPHLWRAFSVYAACLSN